MQIFRYGAYAAFCQAAIYLTGFVVLFTVLSPPSDATSMTAMDKMVFFIEHQTLFSLWNALLYVIFGAVLVVLVKSTYAVFHARSEALADITAVFGYLWCGLVIAAGMVANAGLASAAQLQAASPEQALSIWQTTSVVQNGLGGGVEIVGGIWVLLLSVLGLKQQLLSKGLHGVGFITGIAGCVTLLPGASDAGAVFGLAQIVWFVWLGFALLGYQKIASQMPQQ